MKGVFALLLLLNGFTGYAQSKTEKALIARTYLLSHTVFGTKDSMTLENLFAKQASYGHSGGKIENRREAIAGIIGNKSVYTDTAVSGIHVLIDDKMAIVRHLFKATETNKEGKVSPLNFSMLLVWVKEKGTWRLMARQSVRLP